jgi:hypothetical protein
LRHSIGYSLLKATAAKYNHPELDDASVDSLMKYFHFESYSDLLHFLKNWRAED